MFRVRWERRALDELADLWIRAGRLRRRAITAATRSCDSRLEDNVHREGESRSGRTRLAFCPPLAVTYRIESDGVTVSILQVRLLRRAGGQRPVDASWTCVGA